MNQKTEHDAVFFIEQNIFEGVYILVITCYMAKCNKLFIGLVVDCDRGSCALLGLLHELTSVKPLCCIETIFCIRNLLHRNSTGNASAMASQK